ncbi:hypothetical protein MUP65_01755, partial [Patescibacteria group bacterium]|nr:hypothetical protein [Patescibacteria group bacterium]
MNARRLIGSVLIVLAVAGALILTEPVAAQKIGLVGLHFCGADNLCDEVFISSHEKGPGRVITYIPLYGDEVPVAREVTNDQEVWLWYDTTDLHNRRHLIKEVLFPALDRSLSEPARQDVVLSKHY